MGFNESASVILRLPESEFLDAFQAFKESFFKDRSIEQMKEVCAFLNNAGNDLQDKAISAFQSAATLMNLINKFESIK